MARPWAERTEKEKEYAKNYRNKNYSVLGCSLPRPLADAFRVYCASQGKSVSAVLGEYVREVLRNAEPGKTAEDKNEHSQDRDSLKNE